MTDLPTTSSPTAPSRSVFTLTVFVAALGYFVDIYDIVLFGVVRQASLKDLGIDPALGLTLFGWQMWGMLIGGFLWGILGDKCGRRGVLFGSILTYSLANLANAAIGLVPLGISVYDQYAILRLLAGIGLAGELGAAITLVSETTARERRGYATTLVAAIGVAGAVAALAVSKLTDWRTAYVVGGVLGLGVLALRLRVLESGMYAHAVESRVGRGSLLMLVADPRRLLRFALCVLIGLPLWYVVGVLVVGSPELAKGMGTTAPVDGGYAIMWAYIGLIAGDLASGLFSQWMRSRRLAVAVFLLLAAGLMVVYLGQSAPTPDAIYAYCGLLGVACGYWAVFVTVAAEQFGTNLRATVATVVPNLVRGAVPLWVLLYQSLGVEIGSVAAARIIGLGCIAIALAATWFLSETYGKDLDYQET